jgi:5-methylcytosine-specific restriction endonuclease McrA
MTICLNCGEEFIPSHCHSNQKYCSRKCSDKYCGTIYRITHRKEKVAYNRKWRAEHPEENRDYFRKYNAEHPEKRRAIGRKYYTSHREKILADDRRYYIDNPETLKERHKKYRETHPEQDQKDNSIRRARKAGTDGHYTAKEWLDLCKKTGNRCVRCGSTGKLTADHVIPLVKGGSNHIENIQPLCGHCNCRKGTRDWRYIAVNERE